MRAPYISTMKLKLGNWSDSEAPHSTQLISVSITIKEEEEAETAYWKKSKLLDIYIHELWNWSFGNWSESVTPRQSRSFCM
jgi:hypothetical protein